MSTETGDKKDWLWIVLFLIVFINGFEAGGYQASLWSIGKNYDLTVTSMGLFAAMELFATMLAPILLGVIMCIYVGFENGFAFFVDTLFTDVLKSSAGKFALSLFWAVMIPSRILVGHFTRYASKILITSILMIPATMLVLSASSDPVAVTLLCVPLGFASGAIYPSVLTIMLPYAGKNTATATGIITAATGIGGVVFTAMTGFLADRFGLQTAMLVLVSFFIISLLSALRVIRYRKQ